MGVRRLIRRKSIVFLCQNRINPYFCNVKPLFCCFMRYALVVNEEAAGSGWLTSYWKIIASAIYSENRETSEISTMYNFE